MISKNYKRRTWSWENDMMGKNWGELEGRSEGWIESRCLIYMYKLFNTNMGVYMYKLENMCWFPLYHKHSLNFPTFCCNRFHIWQQSEQQPVSQGSGDWLVKSIQCEFCLSIRWLLCVNRGGSQWSFLDNLPSLLITLVPTGFGCPTSASSSLILTHLFPFAHGILPCSDPRFQTHLCMLNS